MVPRRGPNDLKFGPEGRPGIVRWTASPTNKVKARRALYNAKFFASQISARVLVQFGNAFRTKYCSFSPLPARRARVRLSDGRRRSSRDGLVKTPSPRF